MNALRLVLLSSVLAVLSACGPDSATIAGDFDENAADDAALSQAGRFETFTGRDGQTYFHLLAGNGEKVLASEGYATSQGALAAVASVQTNGVNEARYELRTAADGSSYFLLKAANGAVIAHSELYVSAANAQRAITAVSSIIKTAVVAGPIAIGAAKAETFKGLDGKYYFHVRAVNGEIVLQSQAYSTKAGATGGIASVQSNGANPARYELRASVDGRNYFVLKAANGQVIGFSEMYASRSNAQAGINTCVELFAGKR
jgi:uncharacterized protein YegP (UPF0339 family)